jgi:hypothetical protein
VRRSKPWIPYAPLYFLRCTIPTLFNTRTGGTLRETGSVKSAGKKGLILKLSAMSAKQTIKNFLILDFKLTTHYGVRPMKITSKSKPLIDLVKAVLKHGGEIDWINSDVSRTDKILFIDAPEGRHWAASDCGIICLNWHNGPASEFYNEALALVSEGTI